MSAAPDSRVIVCGAGLTGLTTAWHLRQRGVQVTVLESGEGVGGVVQSTARDGFLVEHGANTCTLTDEIEQLVSALDLTAAVRIAAPLAQRRFIVRNGALRAVPGSPLALLRSPLLSATAKLRLLAEPFIGRREGDADESVAAFVRRRLGSEPLTWAVDPFVSGVYAGDPERLSVKHAFPRLAALEREHGSLARGAIALARRARSSRQQTGVPARRHTMVSFAEGMSTLPRRLAAALGPGTIRLGTQVRAIAREDDGCTVTISRNGVTETLRASTVVSTLPLHALSHVGLPAVTSTAVARLSAVAYPAVASLALGFRRADVQHPLDGFGCLIPSVEARRTLGILFSSTLFEGRAPADQVLLTCFTGGTRHPDLGTASTRSLREVIVPEVQALLGISAAPTFVHHTSWAQAIPQFDTGYDAVLAAVDTIEGLIPGFIVDGQFRRGVSVGDCIAAGATIATRAVAMLAACAPPTPERPRTVDPGTAPATVA